jgi:hypothetical protein
MWRTKFIVWVDTIFMVIGEKQAQDVPELLKSMTLNSILGPTQLTFCMQEVSSIHRHCTVNVGYKIYVLGGHVCTIGTVDTVYIFDTRTKIWTLDGPRLRYGITYDLGCSTLYLADGRHVIIAAGGHPTRKSSVQFYDINAPTTWQGLPNLPINVGEYPHIAYMGK